MKLSEAAKQGRQPAPTQPQPEAHGVRQISFRADGGYRRNEVRQIVKELRDGIAVAGETVDELGIGLCGLLQGGRFPHCEADLCYSSPQNMRAKSFSIRAHASEAPVERPNPIPPGATLDDPNEEYDVDRVNARLQFAAQAAEAARAAYEAQDPAHVAAALERTEYEKAQAMRQLTEALQSVDATQNAENRQQLVALDARLRERGL